jgi:hypothetical protein
MLSGLVVQYEGPEPLIVESRAYLDPTALKNV